jgi:molecular chaperone DnaK (HSP70)
MLPRGFPKRDKLKYDVRQRIREAEYNEVLKAAVADTPPAGHLYKRFKMVLRGQNSGFDTLAALSISGKSRSLMDLTVLSLQFLKDFAISKVTGGFGGDVKPSRDVQWVLTVPAIWNDFGKAFMRKAAFKAGLMENEQSDNLLLVLEPEGASLAVHVGAAQFGLLGASSRFMVLDGGGGTVDITVHEVATVQPLTMKAIAAPTGGDWGGDYVNMEFKKFLAELLGPDLFKEQEMPLEFYTVYSEFDKVKIMFDPSAEPRNIHLIDVLDNKKRLVELAAAYNANHPDKPIVNTPTQRNGFLTMSKALMLSFFEPFLLATVDETRRVMKEVPGIRHIVVVGGFGSSKVLTARMQTEFHRKAGVKVILPYVNPKPQAAIVHGAVYFGLHKDIIQSRVSPYTYGIAVREDGVDEVFFALVRKGEELAHDHEAGFFALPAKANQSAMTWRVYRSDMVNPATVIGEHLLGCLTAVCPPDPIAVNRRQKVTLCFGGSEIRVTIENTKGEIVKGEISMDGDGAYGRCIAVSGGSRTDSNLQQGAASEPVPAKPRSLESPPLPPASGSDTPATSSYGVLQSDYERLVSEAALAKQRREVERRLHNNASKLSTAKRTKNITLVVSTRSEEVSLEQEKVSVFAAISEEQCAALPSKIQDLLDRLFVFSLDIDVKILRDSDVDILGRVEEMYLSAQQALQALTLQPPQPRSGEKGIP